MNDHLDGALTLDTAGLLVAVERLVRRFVVLPTPASYLTVALFVLHTWAFDAAHATPYLVVESPEKQSGKTRLLEVLELICRNSHQVASITAAALFQTVAYGTPTLLIDEADAIFAANSDRNEDLRGVLNAGNAAGSKVIRGGKDGKPVAYGVFCPKVIAGIATGRLPDTIRDRAIVLPIDRKLKSQPVERLRRRRLHADVERLRDDLQRWAQQHVEQLECYELPGSLERISDRAEEAWEPLLAIADLAGGEYPALARAAAEDLSGLEQDGEATTSHTLLVALRDVFGDQDKMFSRDIIASLNGNDELPFGAWNDGTGIRGLELGRLLKRYRIRPSKIRIGETILQGYLREQFKTAWEHYGRDLPVTPGTTPASTGDAGFSDPEHNAECSGSRNGEIAREYWDVPGVTAENHPDTLFGDR